MTETVPDMKALARRYLDLWQEQVSTIASDPAMAEQLAKGIAMLASGPAMMAEAMAQQNNPSNGKWGATHAQPAQTGTADSAPTCPPATAAASADPIGLAEQLARRLAEVEERLAGLEARIAAEGGGAQPKPVRSRRKRPAGT